MINFIKKAVESVEGIKSFLYNTDYRNNFDIQNVEFPCCVLTPIMNTKYDLNNFIHESAELQISIIDTASYEYTGDDLYAINKRCSDLLLQVIANLQVKTKFNKELTFEFILPSGDELVSGVMCNITATMKQGSCIGAPSYVEIVVQPIKKESITRNGKHVISPSKGFNAMREVEVDVNVDLKGSLQDKQVTITENGTQIITADEGFDGLSSVEVNVDALGTNEILAWYDVVDTENPTRLLSASASASIYAMWVDGEEVTPSKTFTFSTLGIHKVKMKILDRTGSSYMFQTCSRLVDFNFSQFRDITILTASFSGCFLLKRIPFFNASKVTTASYAFHNTGITELVLLDMSNNTNFSKFVQGCSKLKEFPLINTSAGTTFDTMFGNCTLKNIPAIDTSKGSNFAYMFTYCHDLTDIPLLDFSKATNLTQIFMKCKNLTNLGGFKNLSVSLYITHSAKVTPLSVHNIIEQALGNFTLTLHATVKENWEASEYYEQDLITMAEKNITIA